MGASSGSVLRSETTQGACACRSLATPSAERRAPGPGPTPALRAVDGGPGAEAVAALRSALFRSLWLRGLVWATVGFALLGGTAVVVARAVLLWPRGTLTWGLLALPVLWAAAVRAAVDRMGEAGGLVVAAGEVERRSLAAWSGRAARVAAPAVAWRGGRAWGLLGLGAVLVLVAFALPDRLVRVMEPARPLDVSGPLGELERQVEVLAEQQVLDEREARELREKLDQVRADAEGNDPSKTWDALDHLRDTVDDAAAEAAEQALRQTQALTEAEALAQAVAEAQAAGDEDAMKQAMADAAAELRELAARDALPRDMAGLDAGQLRQMLDALKDAGVELPKGGAAERAAELAKIAQNIDDPMLRELMDQMARELERVLRENPKLAQELAEKMAKAAGQCQGGGQLSPEQMKALLEVIKSGKLDLKQMLEALRDAQLADAEAARLAEDMGELDAAALRQYLAGLKPGTSAGACAGGIPGRGGINRGPGHGPLQLTGNSDEQGVMFKPVVLPPAKLEAMKDAQLVRVSASAPTTHGEAPASSGGALDPATAAGGGAATDVILPRHEDAVRRFFDRQP